MDLGHEYDLMFGILEEAIGYFPKFATAHRRRGELLVAKLDDKAAVPEFTKAIRLNPPDAHAHSERSLAHRRWAMATLRLGCGISTKRSASSPRIVAFLYDRGQIRRNACDFKGARADFDEAIRLSTGDPGNYYERAPRC
jgi:tetratricopeptide (TPR) repeat protein